MLKKFKNMSIKGKVVTSFTICNIILAILIFLVLVILTKTCSNYEEAYSNYGEVASTTAYSLSAYESLIVDLEKAALISDSGDLSTALTTCMESKEEMQTSFASIEAMLSDDEGNIINEELAAKYADCQAAYNEMAAGFQAIYKSVKTGELAAAEEALLGADFQAKSGAVTTTFKDLYNTANELGTGRMDSIINNKNITSSLIVASLLVVVGIVVLVAATLSRCLKFPAYNMRDGALKMAEGDVNAEIRHFYDDELGELADSLIKMQDNIRAQAEVAKEISEGNLSMTVTANGENDLLGNAIVTMLDEENRVMGGISEAVSEIKTGAQEVASASQNLAQGSTEQASAIQQITASITDINERTRVNADDANTANKLVTQAKEDANDSTAKMREMIDAMADINNSSENISKIIKVIDDIAFQTNILALNAAVEAARAGAHGRGFAVVADEVRNLAGKSAQAASETAELIEDSITKVQKGSKLAEETAAALEAIVAVIDKIVDITNSIAVASNDQATAISQIDQAIGQVSQVVQTNSATSEQCAAASEELSAQAGKLRDMISRYRLKAQPMGSAQNRVIYEQPAAQDFDRIVMPDDNLEKKAASSISLDEGYGKY